MEKSMKNNRKYHTKIPKTNKVEPVKVYYEVEYEYFENKIDLYDWLHCNPDYEGDVLVH
jgi:hypothetical protein